MILAVGLLPASAFAADDPGGASALVAAPAGRSQDAEAAPEGCIAFTSDAPFTVSLGPDKHWDGTIEYSLDGGDWIEYTANTTIESGVGHAVFFRGTGNTRLGEVDDVVKYSTFSLEPADGHAVSCSGSVEALLDYDKVLAGEHPDMGAYAFFKLFQGCTSLASAPALPATELAYSCYEYMFLGCTSLTTPPALPAKTLAASCYDGMFYGCTALASAPALPATGLAYSCYAHMFLGCASLTSAPALPATKLAASCYEYMFSGCTSLTSAPELPATELDKECYKYMFAGCTSLTSAPALPAEKLFTVDSSGTVYNYYDCYSYMFQSCTSLTSVPALPATGLANGCYRRMFRGCTSLTSAPELPATTLAISCYDGMFEDSGVKLSENAGLYNGVHYGAPYCIPSGGGGTDARDALTDMFKGTGGPFEGGTPAINKTYYLPGAPEGCILFTSDAPFTVSLGSNKNWDGTIEYSLDGGNWSEYTAGEPIGSGDGKVVFFRGTGNAGLSGAIASRRSTFSLAPAGGHTVSCLGDAEALLDYRTVLAGGHPGMGEYAFHGLFRGCASLASAPELPAEALAKGCYQAMFEGCTSLTSAPALPAETLAANCYDCMFSGCTSLTSAPVLPATELADSCYSSMFLGCKSLTSAPVLPATELADSCYSNMFLGCTRLASAPALPAEELAKGCYSSVFEGCTSLTSAPALPATTLADHCYFRMFDGCTSLTSAPTLPATTLAAFCYNSMFVECTSLTSAPALPATTLAESCYYGMFVECTSLTSAPALPATTLAAFCYYGMFGGCTSLTSAPELPAAELATQCYSHMFSGCTSLTVPAKLPAEELADGCYNVMFENSGVKVSEEAGTFGGVSYNTSYRIPSEGAGTDAGNALADMFKGTGGPFKGTPAINKTYYLPAVRIDAPTGKTLAYSGAEQTGVEPGEGYALAGEKAADAGPHTATATLLDGYAWSDGTVAAKDVAWTIAPADISEATVSAANQIYDGTELEPLPTVTWEGKGLKQGTDYTVTYRGNTSAGTATVIVKGANNFEGEATATFEIAKRKATVTTGSASKAYDGKPLTNSEAKITGLVNGETAAVEATGSQTEVGSSANTYAIEWGTAKAQNYTVTEELGTLTVEAAPAGKGALTFDLAGGTLDGKTGTITIEADVGDTIKLPKAPTKDGYAFKFWKGSEYAAGAEYKVEGDHAFTAEWIAVHTVTFDANGHGKAPDAQTVEHGEKAKKPANPTADGYTFGGWYKDKACKEAYDFSAPVTEDVTLYAKWTKKSSSGSGTSPKTGDPLAGAFAVALALAAASALALAASRRMRRS